MTYKLFTPGPTPVSNNIQSEIQKPLIYHRDSEFVDLFENVIQGLKYILQTENDVLAFTSSGSGGLEAAIVNLFSEGDKVCVVEQGKFSSRFVEICEWYNINVKKIELRWGASVSIDQIDAIIEQHSDIKAFIMPHCETSTGALNDVELISNYIHENSNAILIVDAISTIGAVPFKNDEWGIDVVVISSNKGILNPPGLAFVAVNSKAWELHKQIKRTSYYFDFTRTYKSYKSGKTTPFTPAIPLVRGVHAATTQIKEMGFEKLWQHHYKIAKACRASFEAMKFKIFPDKPSSSVTVVELPSQLNAAEVVQRLKERYNIVIAKGQGKLKDKIIRIGHFGNTASEGLSVVISNLEEIFIDMGWDIVPGVGASKFNKELIAI